MEDEQIVDKFARIGVWINLGIICACKCLTVNFLAKRLRVYRRGLLALIFKGVLGLKTKYGVVRVLNYILVFFCINSCGNNEDEKISARCMVNQKAGSVDLGFCMDFENVTEEAAKEICDSVEPATTDEGITVKEGAYSKEACVVEAGTEGCQRTENTVVITSWLIGTGWPEGANADKTICEDGGVPVVK